MDTNQMADAPTSAGMANALRRARQLADLRWCPVRPFPAGIRTGKEGENSFWPIFLPPWRPQTGANYSAARFDEKYIGFNVSLHTYMTALANPDSVLYTRSLHGKAPLSSAFYGTVCSEFVSYVMDFPFHIDCQQLPFLPWIEILDPHPLENLQLCDILNERTRHSAIITGITRSSDGTVLDITVTESIPPHIQSCTYTPKEFEEYWLKNGYEILRSDKLDSITYTPDPWIHLEGDPETPPPAVNSMILPDYGDRANYLLGGDVTLSVFDPSCTAVSLRLNGTRVGTLPLSNGKAVFTPDKPGFYSASAICGETESTPAEFCVVQASAAPAKTDFAAGEPIRPVFSNPCGDRMIGWVVKTPGLAKVWGYPTGEDGQVPSSAVLNEGEYRIISLYRNVYGVYSSCPSDVFRVHAKV